MLKIEKHAKSFNVKPVVQSKFHTQYIIEPLYRGYGHTVGNALRRVLLSSIPGAAIKGVRIDGVLNEFSVMDGVKEAVTDIILNIKEIVIKTEEPGDRKMTLSVKGPKIVTAADIIPEVGLEIVNPEQIICTITTKREIDIEFLVGTGEGFVVSEDIDTEKWAVDYLAVDAIYTPIKKVSYSVQDTMVGRMTDFDKLTLDLETNGSIESNDALSYAVELLSIHLYPLLDIGNKLEQLRTEVEVEAEDEPDDDEPIENTEKIEELDLTVRSFNCLKKAGIETIGDIAKLSTNELTKIKNLGKKSFDEIVERMLERGYDLAANNIKHENKE
ncbi:MAG: DNA-directed RNA polymerase subunit alpha [Fusobacteriaceae bacterium]